MRNKFSEFSYKPNLEKLWQECDFVFDANVLLDLYYDRKVYTNFINILENKIPDRIWMPYQVGLEYHINRVDGVQKISNDYYNFINGIQSLKGVKTIYNKLNETHCINLGKYMDLEEISKNLTYIEECSKDLNTKIEGNPNFLADDEIMNKLHETFGGKTGKQYTDSELNEIYKEGEIRNENKIPPSFKDKGYGDLVLWKQIIDHALKKDCPLILVTSDSKRDWWLTSDKKPMCPHPTLIKEFLETVGKDFYMYNISDFLRESKEYLDADVETETIKTAEEIEQIREFAGTLAKAMSTSEIAQRTMAETVLKAMSTSEIAQRTMAEAILKAMNNSINAYTVHDYLKLANESIVKEDEKQDDPEKDET